MFPSSIQKNLLSGVFCPIIFLVNFVNLLTLVIAVVDQDSVNPVDNPVGHAGYGTGYTHGVSSEGASSHVGEVPFLHGIPLQNPVFNPQAITGATASSSPEQEEVPFEYYPVEIQKRNGNCWANVWKFLAVFAIPACREGVFFGEEGRSFLVHLMSSYRTRGAGQHIGDRGSRIQAELRKMINWSCAIGDEEKVGR